MVDYRKPCIITNQNNRRVVFCTGKDRREYLNCTKYRGENDNECKNYTADETSCKAHSDIDWSKAEGILHNPNQSI